MNKTKIIQNKYSSILDLLETEMAIKEVKNNFESVLSEELNLVKVSAPLLLLKGNGLNDNLNGVERVVIFDAIDIKDSELEIVQSLAKWKRVALSRYGFQFGTGLYTDMDAIRRDEILDNTHSLYVDQWDWEKVITKEERNEVTLKAEVIKIYNAMKNTERYIYDLYPTLEPVLPEKIFFISTAELEALYPGLTPKEREDKIAEEHGAVFIMQIGGILQSGKKHDGRSPDYDDWTLNGDIIFWSPILERSLEVSSMGIRVDKDALLKQLKLTNNENRLELKYHKSIINDELPYTIGGGIGQSRLCMFFLKKVHIGEVQASVWNNDIVNHCLLNNINLL
jgi:aspartate--ammonia ligase